MKRVFEFVVSKRFWILGVMLCLTLVCAVLSRQVTVNADMAKYLPDDSSMRIGMNIMEEHFDEMAETYTIRVMSEGLGDDREAELLGRLRALPYVESVAHEESEAYHEGEHALFVITTPYAYDTPEELELENRLANDFSEYNIVHKNGDETYEGLTFGFMIAAVLIAFVILTIMCESWVEPILFLATIGLAVVLNKGTNAMLGEISAVTSSVAMILQMALSMDYSIILINRYRQKKATCLSNQQAMSEALCEAFSSIASSSLTTVVGLLALAFMDFKIGFDFGVVLAKGVFLSMVCVLTVLPCLLLMFDKLILKSAKKTLHVPMGAVSRFSYRFRYVLTAVFVLMFCLFGALQGNTDIAYKITAPDPVADVFPNDNMIVLLYSNGDEAQAKEIAASLKQDEKVRRVLDYPNLLGEAYETDELAGAIDNLSSTLGVSFGNDAMLDPALLELVYYHRYGGELSELTIQELARFLSQEILTNELFAEKLGDDMHEQVDQLLKFTDTEALTASRSAAELAEYLGVDEQTVQSVMLYYYTQHGGVNSGTMTLSTFASFILDELADDADYGSLFDTATLAKVEQLRTFADPTTADTPRSYAQIADLLGIEEDTARLLFVYYHAMSDEYTPQEMTLSELVSFLQTDILTDPLFSSYVDDGVAAQIDTLAPWTEASTLKTPHSKAELADLVGIEESLLDLVFRLYATQDMSGKTVTLPQFMTFLMSEIVTDPMFADYFDAQALAQLEQVNGFVALTQSGETLSASQLASLLGMPERTVKSVFFVTSIKTQQDIQAMSLPAFLEAAEPLASEEQLAQMAPLMTIVDMTAQQTGLDASAIAEFFGIDNTLSEMMLRLYVGGQTTVTMSVEQLLTFVLNDIAKDPLLSGYLNDELADSLSQMQTLVDAVITGKTFSPSQLSAMLDMDSAALTMVYTYHDAVSGKALSWTLPLNTVVDFLLANADTFSSMMDAQALEQLGMAQRLMNAASVAQTAYGMANLIGMDTAQIEQLYLLYISRHGDTSSWTVSVETLVSFINSDVLTHERYATLVDDEAKAQLAMAQTLIDAAVSQTTYTAQEAYTILGTVANELDASLVELLYLYHAAHTSGDPAWTMSFADLVDHLCNEVITDERFASFIDEDLKERLMSLQGVLENGISMLKSDNYSRMIIYTSLPIESEETTAFMAQLDERCAALAGDYHLIGNSAMSYEMQQTFDAELTMITLLTSIAIFLIVMLTFRSLIIPLLLVAVVQCGVYITITVIGWQGFSIYFLSLLIVECILMGATVDYAILFTNYLRDYAKEKPFKEALHAAYNGAIHTVLTSGLILVVVTGILGYTATDPTIGQVCQAISIGSLASILLILFILPGMLCVFRRLVVGKPKGDRPSVARLLKKK